MAGYKVLKLGQKCLTSHLFSVCCPYTLTSITVCWLKYLLKWTLVQSSVGLTESHMREALSRDHKVISYFFHCLGIEPDFKKRLLRKWLSMRETWSDL